jgi:hypothetical protein
MPVSFGVTRGYTRRHVCRRHVYDLHRIGACVARGGRLVQGFNVVDITIYHCGQMPKWPVPWPDFPSGVHRPRYRRTGRGTGAVGGDGEHARWLTTVCGLDQV